MESKSKSATKHNFNSVIKIIMASLLFALSIWFYSPLEFELFYKNIVIFGNKNWKGWAVRKAYKIHGFKVIKLIEIIGKNEDEETQLVAIYLMDELNLGVWKYVKDKHGKADLQMRPITLKEFEYSRRYGEPPPHSLNELPGRKYFLNIEGAITETSPFLSTEKQ